MKIEMTVDAYSSARGFTLKGAGVHEVEEERARYLLATFPEWFQPAGDEAEVGAGVEDVPAESQERDTGPIDEPQEAPEAVVEQAEAPETTDEPVEEPDAQPEAVAEVVDEAPKAKKGGRK